jgi:hypothetical protein
MIAGEVRWMDDAASRIVAHYERHATSWDADRRAVAWIDKPCIERSFFHLKHDDQRMMFRIFAEHSAADAILMFNAGFSHGEAMGSYRGDPLYHASLDPSEYEDLLASSGFELIEYSRGDPVKGGRIFWLARAVQSNT